MIKLTVNGFDIEIDTADENMSLKVLDASGKELSNNSYVQSLEGEGNMDDFESPKIDDETVELDDENDDFMDDLEDTNDDETDETGEDSGESGDEFFEDEDEENKDEVEDDELSEIGESFEDFFKRTSKK